MSQTKTISYWHGCSGPFSPQHSIQAGWMTTVWEKRRGKWIVASATLSRIIGYQFTDGLPPQPIMGASELYRSEGGS